MYGSVITENRYMADKMILEVRRYEESVKGNDKQALGDFLKLMDDHKAGKITDFSIRCESKDGKVWRYVKTYTEANVAIDT